MSEFERKPNHTKENEEAIRNVFAKAILQEGKVIRLNYYRPPEKNNRVYRYFHNSDGTMLFDANLPPPQPEFQGLQFSLDNYIFIEKDSNGTIQRDTRNINYLKRIVEEQDSKNSGRREDNLQKQTLEPFLKAIKERYGLKVLGCDVMYHSPQKKLSPPIAPKIFLYTSYSDKEKLKAACGELEKLAQEGLRKTVTIKKLFSEESLTKGPESLDKEVARHLMKLDEFSYTNSTKYRGATTPEVKKFLVHAGEQPPSSLDETLKNIQSNNALRLWLDKDSPAMFYYLSDSGTQSFPYKKQKDTGKPHTNKPMTAFLKKIRRTIGLSTLGGALHDIHRINIQRPLAPAQVLYLYTTPEETETLLTKGPAIISRLAEEARAEGQSYDNIPNNIPKDFHILQHAVSNPGEKKSEKKPKFTEVAGLASRDAFDMNIMVPQDHSKLSDKLLILRLERKFLHQYHPERRPFFSNPHHMSPIISFLNTLKTEAGMDSIYCKAQSPSVDKEYKAREPYILNLAIYCNKGDWPRLERYMGTLEEMARDVKVASAISGGLAR